MKQPRKQQLHDEIEELIVDDQRARELTKASSIWLSLDLTLRQLCDLELLLNGGFSPLKTFLSEKDYVSVMHTMRLSTGELWPIPVILDVSQAFSKKLKKNETIALRDREGIMLAALTIDDIYKPDKTREAKHIYGTTDAAHPGVEYLMNQTGDYYISGKLEGIRLPSHYDFNDLRHTPNQLRSLFNHQGWARIVAFQTRNPMHRAHVELTVRAAKQAEANLLIHPVVGMTKLGDIDYYTRVKIYQKIIRRFPASTSRLALLPLAMRMAGPREALWHAIIRKNYGATHFIVGRDHAGPGKDANGKDFYGPYDAQNMVEKFENEIGIKMLPFKMMVFVPDKDQYLPEDEITQNTSFLNISGTELRARLLDGRPLPEWFTYPEVAHELHLSYPQRSMQGLTIFFTGLSGSGKSTIANALQAKLLESGHRRITLLDGDIVRKNLSSELGFSKEHRDINIKRIGFIAAEITKHGGVALCAPIAPYDSLRRVIRRDISQYGGFILVYVNTPIEECERRDRKGLYQKARQGEIEYFTGVSDPYEAPKDADIILDTLIYNPDELTQQIILHLEKEGYIGSSQKF